MPIVALDLLYLEPGATGGMETYARELVPLLPAAMPEARFVVLAAQELAEEWESAPWHPDVAMVAAPASAASRLSRTAVEMTVLERLIRRAGADLVHGLGNVVPIGPGPRRVVTVHDCIAFTHPEATSRILAAGVRALIRAGVRRSCRVIADSKATSADLQRILDVPVERIDVVALGPGSSAVAAPSDPSGLRSRLGIPAGPIVLALGARRPHKNVVRLVESVAALPGAVLVLPGYASGYDAEVLDHAARLGVSDRVVLTGWIDEGDLEALFAAARCLAMPSLVEGFGLPVLEAMARGVPVAASDLPVLREVGGDAIALFDPFRADSIAAALAPIVADDGERERMAEAGRARVAEFSWRRTAAMTAEVYRRALQRA